MKTLLTTLVLALGLITPVSAQAQLWQCYQWPRADGEPAFSIAGSRQAGIGTMRTSEAANTPVTFTQFAQSGLNGVWFFENGDQLIIQPDGEAYYIERGQKASGVDYRCRKP